MTCTLLRKKFKILDTGVERPLTFRSPIRRGNLGVHHGSLMARTNVNNYSQDLREFHSKVATGFCYLQEKAKQSKLAYFLRSVIIAW